MKKFGFYFKKGFVVAKMAMKGKSIFTKFLLGLYLILSFFGKLFLPLRPVFLIADNNLAMMIVEGHDFEINKLFEGINVKKRYSSLLLSCLFVEGIVIAAALALLLPLVIWQSTFLYNEFLPPIIFMIVFGVAILALALALQVVYSPMGFVTCKGKDLNSGDILYLSKEGSASAKGKIIGIYLLNYLFLLLITAVFVLVPLLVASMLRDENGNVSLVAGIIILIIIIVFMFINIFVLSFFRLSAKVALYSLFYDNAETKHIVLAKKESEKDSFVPLFTDDKEVKDNE